MCRYVSVIQVLTGRSVFRYNDVTVPQVVGDLEAMEGKSPPQSIPGIQYRGRSGKS